MINIIAGIVTVLSLLFALRCYLELREWAHRCQNARIAIAYKGRVKMQAPLTEWMLWCEMLEKDKKSNGRVIYGMGGTSIAIYRTTEFKDTNTGAAKEGTWKAKDESISGTKQIVA